MNEMAADLDGVEDALPVSSAQAGMLWHSLSEPGSGVYLGVFTADLPRDVDLDRLKAAWAETVARHQSLRSIFVWEDLDEPVQVILGHATPTWEREDFSGLTAEEAETRWRALKDTLRRDGLDLASAPAMRFLTVAMPGGLTRFAWVSHHALLDDWSAALVLSEVARAYLGRPVAPPAEPEPVRAFADWLAGRDTRADLRYWLDAFRGFDTPTRLPVTAWNAPPEAATAAYGRRGADLDPDVARQLSEAARARHVTPAAIAMTLWALVLNRLTGEDDVAFGLATAIRPPELPGIDTAIGNHVTTLPTRVRLGEGTLAETIQSVHDAALEARAHETLSLSDWTNALDLGRGTQPFDTILSVKRTLSHASDDLRSAEVFGNLEIGTRSNFGIAFLFSPDDPARIDLLFDTARHSEAMADTVLGLVQTAFAALPACLDSPVHDLPLVSDQVHATEPARATLGPLPDEILAQAARAPEATAIVAGDTRLSYGDLATRSDRLARRLVAAGVGQGDRVAILLPRGADTPVAILAAMRAGAAYVPVDPAYPPDRIEGMLRAAAPKATIATDLAPGLADAAGTLIPPDGSDAPDAPLPDIDPQGPAYVIFTSGSTGTPKGVVVSHANLAASTAARLDWFGDAPASYLLLPSFSFDSSVAGIFWTLATGGTLVVTTDGAERDPAAIADLIARERVTHTLCLPSLHAMVLDGADDAALASLKTVIVAGEEVQAAQIAQHRTRLPDVRLVNEYGPTEGTVWATVADLSDHATTDGPVPIGHPIPGALCILRDVRGRPVPDGVPGELLIGGPTVAQGYLGRPDESASRFVALPDHPGTRFYRTGDLVSRAPDGALLYHGRADAQIKIRGHRVEPGEIESLLASRPDIREAAVIPFGPKGGQLLAAFVVGEVGFDLDADALRVFLRERLPEWMLPARIAQLAGLPRTANGKVDRRALPVADLEAGASAYVPPATSMEGELAQIWQRVLWLDRRVGVTEDFFDLGGHSLLSMKLVNEINAVLKIRVPVARLGRIGTVRDQARLLERIARETTTTPDAGPKPIDGQPATGTGALAGLTPEERDKLDGYLASWPPPVRPGGLIRVLNPEGTKPPLFFWFMGTIAFERLARELGPDQPVYGMRAGQGVVDIPNEDDQWAAQRRVALTYINEILALQPEGPYYLGGECQGGTVALNAAHLLTGMRRQVGTVVLLEKTPPVAYPGHVSILFTRQGFLNPNRRFSEPELAWNRFYGSWTVDYLDGGYLDWFDHVHAPATSRAIGRRLDEARGRALLPLPPDAYSAEWQDISAPAAVPPGAVIRLTGRVRNTSGRIWRETAESGIRIAAQWRTAADAAVDDRFHAHDLARPVGPGGTYDFEIPVSAPPDAGRLRLVVDLLEEGIATFSGRGAETGVAEILIDPAAPLPAVTPEETAPTEADAPPESVLAAARAARDRGRTAEAVAALRAAEGQGAAILRDLALALFEAGETREAARRLDAALALDPSDAEVRIALGRLRLGQRRPLAAAGHFVAAARGTDDPVLRHEALSRLNYPRRAAAEFRRWLQRIRVGRDVRNDPGSWPSERNDR